MENAFLNVLDFGATGSEYVTTAHSRKNSNVFKLENTGDFKTGDEVLLKGCDPHFETQTLFLRKDTSPVNTRPWKHNQPLLDRVQLDGYDGSQGDWIVYVIDIYPESPNTFRWTKNSGIEWHEDVPLRDGWIQIDGKIRVKINQFPEREWGCAAVFVCSSRMVAVIEKAEGDTVTLSKAAKCDAVCEFMHSDTAAIQRTIDAALAENKSVFLPNGRYRLTGMLTVNEPCGLTIQGESEIATILDNSLGAVGIERPEGSCFYVKGGESIILRNLFMVGCYGFEERDRGANLFCRGATSVYGFYFEKSNATCFVNTRRILVEHCHARKMSGECFYSCGTPRELTDPPGNCTRSMTYMHCSVEDCARNAFNNNDKSENTSILHCRIKDIGNAAWEGSSRFTVIHGCYISNTRAEIQTGNTRRARKNHQNGGIAPAWNMLHALGTAQHVISDNYFEAGSFANYPAIGTGSFSSQVTIKGNVFVNFNAPAIFVEGEGTTYDTPAENIIISSNSIDLTAVGTESRERYGIKITSNFVTVSDNQIYVRGECDANVKGIIVSDDVTRLNIHDNTICGCDVGIETTKVKGTVGIVVDDKTFYRNETVHLTKGKPMLLRPDSHRYRTWYLKWLSDGTESEIADFDPVELTFTLKEPRKMNTGDEFYISPPRTPSRIIHHNLIDNCNVSINAEGFAEGTAVIRDNICSERRAQK